MVNMKKRLLLFAVCHFLSQQSTPSFAKSLVSLRYQVIFSNGSPKDTFPQPGDFFLLIYADWQDFCPE